MDTLGPLLGQSLARNIGGNALRSELDRLCEPLRKLVTRYPMAKDWLQSGLDHPSFPSEKVDAEQKSLFVKKIIRYITYIMDFIHNGCANSSVVLEALERQIRSSEISGYPRGVPTLHTHHEPTMAWVGHDSVTG